MKLVLFIFLLFLAVVTQGQVRISGAVTDHKSKPLAGASITLKDSYDGGTSDSAGAFIFETSEKGPQQLIVTLMGYHTVVVPVNIDNNHLQQNISLKEQVTELRAVVISAGSFEASDKNKGAVLSPLDIVTTPSANGDVTSALKSLPGTQQVGESEGLFVRGGSASESKIYIDGTLVNNFFYSSTPGIATRGRFNPFLFKGTVFSTGGYSALYGQALSSALILESNDLPDSTEADLSVSIIGVGGGIQHLSKNKKSSWGASYNYANLWLAFNVIKQRQDFYKVPVSHQGDANFRIKTKNGGFLKYYGYVSTNRVGFRTGDLDSLNLKNAFNIDNINIYQNLSLKDYLGKGWRINTAVSFSTNRDDIANELQNGANQKVTVSTPVFYSFKNFSLLSTARYAQGRIVLEKRLRGISALRFGSDYFYSNEKSTYTLFDGQRFDETITDHLYAGFAEADVYITNNLAAKLGSRVEHSAIINKWNIAPRLSLAYKLGNNSQASVAYGIFYQNPERRLLPGAAGIDYSQAAHYIVQYSRQTPDRTLRAEMFFKQYDNLYKTATGIVGRDIAANNDGFGEAKGIEFFWRDKKTIKNVDYWISYSYLDTKRDFLNYPYSLQPSFAANHTAAFIIKRFVVPWRTGFNLSYNFATGRPYYHLKFDNALGKSVITDQGKTINYHNLSFSVNYLPNLGKPGSKTFLVWVLGINNVLGQEQIFNYNYNNSGTRKEPLRPASRRFAFIACFFSFGTDRTQDAINNNL